MTTFAFPASITTTVAVSGWDQGFTKDSTSSQGEVRYLRQNNTYRIGFMPDSTTGVVLFFVNNNSTTGDPTYWTKNGQTVSDNTQVVGGDVIALFSSSGTSNGTFTVQHSWLGTSSSGGGTSTEGVVTPVISLSQTQLVGSGWAAGTYTFRGPVGVANETLQPDWVDLSVVVSSNGLVSENDTFAYGNYEFQGSNFFEQLSLLSSKKVFCNFW